MENPYASLALWEPDDEEAMIAPCKEMLGAEGANETTATD